MENSVPQVSVQGGRNATEGIAIRRQSGDHANLSRSAPDALTLPYANPLRREPTSRSSLPESPCCSVGTQTPTTTTIRFEFPPSLDSDDDLLDGIDVDVNFGLDFRRASRTSTGTTISFASDQGEDVAGTSPPQAEPSPSLWNRCLRRLSSHTDVVHKVGLHRRVSFCEDRKNIIDLKLEFQGVGQQLRSIADDFERCRLTRTRSMSFVMQKKR